MDKYQSWKPTDCSNKEILNQTQTEAASGKLCLGTKKGSQCFYDFPIDSRSMVADKEIITELALVKFSLQDVEHLQKLNRDLRAEKINKTMAYIKLEQEYQLMKNEILDVKQENEIRRRETCAILKKALKEISSHQKCPSQYPEPTADNLAHQRGCEDNPADLAARERFSKEFSDLTGKYDALQRIEAERRCQLAIYEEKYETSFGQ